MNKINIVNIRHKVFTLEDQDLRQVAANEDFRFRFTVFVVHNKKIKGESEISVPTRIVFNERIPFTLYRLGTPLAVINRYSGNKLKIDDLLSARSAFKQLNSFAQQCSERIVADLFCQVILKEIDGKSEDEELVFFVEKSATDKMLGRLATLNLNLDRITICFIIYSPSELMTIAMSSKIGKLRFDINRLMTTDSAEFVGPYPGEAEESLIQSYFHKPAPSEAGGGKYAPMKFDIFTQGLGREMMEIKKDLIQMIFTPESKEDTSTSRGTAEPRLLFPAGFDVLGDYLEDKQLKEDVKNTLMRLGE